MTFSFYLLYSDPMPITLPLTFRVEAYSRNDAIQLAAKQNEWAVTEIDEQSVWFQADGKDFEYSVSEVE